MPVASGINRQTVDLSSYPDLVVICLGMRVNMLTGIKTLLGLGPQIQQAVKDKPDGLLLHEDMLWSLKPPHLGMRQYWRDFESLEKWSRALPHQKWWQDFVRDSGGTGFWHETYFMRGGMETIFDDMGGGSTGMMRFAPLVQAKGAMFSARRRMKKLVGEPLAPNPVAEEEYA